MPTESTPARRAPRADVTRNRARILEAARMLFAERGNAVQMHEVASAAGVGIGTVYRHFAARDALIEAAAEHRFADIEEFAQSVCLADTHGQGLARYLRHVGEVLERDRGLTSAIEAARGAAGSEPRGEARARLEEVIGGLIERGQAAGALRPDCAVADVYMISGCLSSVIRTRSGDWRRLLDLVIDGLRPR
jgi:AcrR family transcriptional regulator